MRREKKSYWPDKNKNIILIAKVYRRYTQLNEGSYSTIGYKYWGLSKYSCRNAVYGHPLTKLPGDEAAKRTCGLVTCSADTRLYLASAYRRK